MLQKCFTKLVFQYFFRTLFILPGGQLNAVWRVNVRRPSAPIEQDEGRVEFSLHMLIYSPNLHVKPVFD
jgi:hypothetical protein